MMKKYPNRFSFWFQYWSKVLANLGLGFDTGPKPKLWFRSYTKLASPSSHLLILVRKSYLNGKDNSVQEPCAKSLTVHILKFEILQPT